MSEGVNDPLDLPRRGLGRVLVVDDERLLREQIRDLLEGAGYGVVARERCGQVLEAIRREGPDVVLMDLILPDGDGIELLPFMREVDPHLPVVIITGHANLEHALQALRRGAYDFLTKPFSGDLVLNAVRRAREKRRADLQGRHLMLELSQKVNEFLVLHQIGEAVSSTLELDEVLLVIVESARNALVSEASSLLLVDEATGDLVFEVALGERGRMTKAMRLKPGQGLVGWVATRGEAVAVADVRTDPRFSRQVDEATGFATRSVLAVPLKAKGQTIGVLETINKRGGESYDQDDQRLLGLIAAQAAMAIENAKLYSQVRRQLEELQELEKMKEHLMQLLVHDLQNPLTSLTLYLDRGPERPDDPFLGDARRSCRNLSGLVNDLLDISRMEEKRLTLVPSDVDFGDLLRETVEDFAPVAADDEKQIRADVPPDLPVVRADRGLLGRVLANLTNNAIRHSFPGGEVVLRVSVDGGALRVDVIDQGEGIPPEFHQKVFEKFGQVESKMRSHRTGRGLGLTFCKMAVEAHGGRIWVTSAPGQGSTFSFTVPLAPA